MNLRYSPRGCRVIFFDSMAFLSPRFDERGGSETFMAFWVFMVPTHCFWAGCQPVCFLLCLACFVASVIFLFAVHCYTRLCWGLVLPPLGKAWGNCPACPCGRSS